jgi:hypothetical protein
VTQRRCKREIVGGIEIGCHNLRKELSCGRQPALDAPITTVLGLAEDDLPGRGTIPEIEPIGTAPKESLSETILSRQRKKEFAFAKLLQRG